MEDSFVKLMRCRFCGGTAGIALNQRLKPIKGEVFDKEPCEKCKKHFDEGMKFFIGDCGHQGFIKPKALKKLLTKEGLKELGKEKIFRMEICPICMDFIKMEDCKKL